MLLSPYVSARSDITAALAIAGSLSQASGAVLGQPLCTTRVRALRPGACVSWRHCCCYWGLPLPAACSCCSLLRRVSVTAMQVARAALGLGACGAVIGTLLSSGGRAVVRLWEAWLGHEALVVVYCVLSSCTGREYASALPCCAAWHDALLTWPGELGLECEWVIRAAVEHRGLGSRQRPDIDVPACTCCCAPACSQPKCRVVISHMQLELHVVLVLCHYWQHVCMWITVPGMAVCMSSCCTAAGLQ